MKLPRFDKFPKDKLDATIDRIYIGKLFYVWAGRNAWWSTWSTQFSPGCFHASLSSAKAFCEKLRTQGTVFYINEIPALIFSAGNRFICAAEINTRDFFRAVDVEALRTAAQIIPPETWTLNQAKRVFENTSNLWPKRYRWEDSAQIAFGEDELEPEVLSISDRRSSLKSQSLGSQYSLHWSTRPFEIPHDRAFEIFELLTNNGVDKPKIAFGEDELEPEVLSTLDRGSSLKSPSPGSQHSLYGSTPRFEISPELIELLTKKRS